MGHDYKKRYRRLQDAAKNGVHSEDQGRELLEALDDRTTDPEYSQAGDPWSAPQDTGDEGTIGEKARDAIANLDERSRSIVDQVAGRDKRYSRLVAGIARKSAPKSRAKYDFEQAEQVVAMVRELIDTLLEVDPNEGLPQPLRARIRKLGELERLPMEAANNLGELVALSSSSAVRRALLRAFDAICERDLLASSSLFESSLRSAYRSRLEGPHADEARAEVRLFPRLARVLEVEPR